MRVCECVTVTGAVTVSVTVTVAVAVAVSKSDKFCGGGVACVSPSVRFWEEKGWRKVWDVVHMGGWRGGGRRKKNPCIRKTRHWDHTTFRKTFYHSPPQHHHQIYRRHRHINGTHAHNHASGHLHADEG